MDKANIIISIIIVLCIAAAVAAYGLTNTDNPVFSDLSSMGANSNTGNGLGNNSTTGNGSSVTITGDSNTASSDSGSSDSGSSDSGSPGPDSSYSDSSSSDSSYSDSSDSGSNSDSSDSGSNSDSSSSTQLSYSDAESIANSAIAEPGCYAGGGYYSDGYWIFTIYDENGTAVDSIGVDDASGSTDRV